MAPNECNIKYDALRNTQYAIRNTQYAICVIFVVAEITGEPSVRGVKQNHTDVG